MAHPNAPQGRAGCSGVIVFMIASLALVLGLFAGAGGLFGYFQYDSAAARRALDLEEESSVAIAPVRAPADCPVCPTQQAPPIGAYALVYPIEETLRIQGKLNREALRETLIEKRSELQLCYSDVLERDPSVKGELTLQFTLARSGKVQTAVARKDSVNSAALKRCVLDRVRAWQMGEKVVKDALVTVKFDLLFTPLGATSAAP